MIDLKPEPISQMAIMTQLSLNKNISGITNKIFRIENQNAISYFLPVYLRMKVKNIVTMDLDTLEGSLNATIICSVGYGDLPKEVVKYLSQNIQLVMHRGEILQLKDDDLQIKYKNNQKKSMMSFTIRRMVSARLQGLVFWTPFELINLITPLTFRTLKTYIGETKYTIRFNLMDCKDQDVKFSLSEAQRFGMYRIAEKMLDVEYSNQFAYSKSIHAAHSRKLMKVSLQKSDSINGSIRVTKNAMDEEQEHLNVRSSINNFQYAHFILPVYKKPLPALITIYFPLILLGIINIGIFYQEAQATGKKMLNIGALMISFVALIPTVRQETPVSPTVSCTQILVFLQAFTTVMALFQMIEVRSIPNYVQVLGQDGYAIVSVLITVIVATFPIVAYIFHSFVWKNMYHKDSDNITPQSKFNPSEWKNQACDRYFTQIDGFQQFIFSPDKINDTKKSKKRTTKKDLDDIVDEKMVKQQVQ